MGTSVISNYPFKTEDVLNLLGYSIDSNRASVDIQCPFCKSTKKKLNFDLRSSFYRCNKNPQHHGNILTFYANCLGISNKEAYREITEKLKLNLNADMHTPLKPERKIKEYEFDAEKTNSVFQQIIAHSWLSSKNRKSLLDRGFSNEDINRLGYKTLPERNGKEICKFTESLGIKDLSGVPGTFISKKGTWMLYHGKRGIIVPYHSFFNKLHGIQIRKDNDVLDDENDNKFYYLSSRYMHGGTSASQVAHYAGKFIKEDSGQEHLYIPNGILVLTEGGMKADLFYCLTGQPCMAIPGVHCLDLLEKELPILKKYVKEILIAYDMDRLMNINVLEALCKIEKKIKAHGLLAKNLAWSTSFKNHKNETSALDVEHSFVFTPNSLLKAKSGNWLDDILIRATQCNRNRIYFALTGRDELSAENSTLYDELKRACKKHPKILHTECIFWELKLKGIDDYYAFKQKNIIP